MALQIRHPRGGVGRVIKLRGAISARPPLINQNAIGALEGSKALCGFGQTSESSLLTFSYFCVPHSHRFFLFALNVKFTGDKFL